MSSGAKNLESRTVQSRILLSTGSQVVGQVLTAIFAIITLKIITNSLGIEHYGIYATAIAFVATFSLIADLGVSAITGREIAKEPERADEIISYNLGLRILLCLIAIPVIIGLSYAFYPHGSPLLKTSIAFLASYLVFDAVRSVLMAYFTSKIRSDVSALIGTVQQLILLLGCLIITPINIGVYGFIGVFVASNFLSMVIALYISKQHVAIRPKVNLAYWRTNIKLSLSLGIILIINLLYLRADSLIISIFKGPTEVGIYGIAYSLIMTLLALPGFIMTALIPSMATSRSSAGLKPLVEKAYQYMVILASLLAIGGVIIKDDLVVLVSSQQFIGAAVPFAILCLASAFTYLNNVFGFASVSVHKHHKLVYVSLATLLLNILLNVLLVPRYSIIGSAWATVACEFLAFVAVYYVFSRETTIKIPLLRYTYKPVIAALLTLIVLYYFNKVISHMPLLLHAVTISLLLMTFYTVALYALRGMPSEIQQYSSRFIKRLLQRNA